ncbi:DEAD/DEAH box helicase family protein [Riemerella anatipestifer]|uniref:DEAD/DEAH box helicase family protein n=1 Tax=Riemerella anatipestifer TaxID=34085 RepID=UPI00207B606C|nr:DEAD/DEAH box helicase family protein [Riemerella anatipestifer]
MQLEITNSAFQDYPIEFKEINPEDFQYIFNPDGTREERNCFEIENNGEKIIVSPNEDGYINEELQSHIELEHKNTVVINAAVGQGKSYSIIQIIKRYYDAMQNGGQQYLIFVASPFVSLVKQYYDDIVEAGIPESQIYNYNNLGRYTETNYLDRAIQVITVNTLLGNPGEDGFKNSDIKREYLNHLTTYCEENNIKAVFIYDELHDSFQNFKQKYIFNLWKWRNVIHKNFVLSATYNEASKVVIEYLAELTDFKIQIIESERVRFPQKQSSLYLHYSPDNNFTSSTLEIKELITKLISRGKKIDILCYSKTLAKSLLNSRDKIGKLLVETYGEIKDCTSELITNQRPENEEPKNQFDNTKCNVGTNFKTGVSIRKENHAFIIILPPRSTRMWFRNKYGIFSGGINSVIQALARQRNKGEIHIILSRPDKFDFSTLKHTEMNPLQKEEFENYYNLITYHKDPKKLVKYIKLNRQNFFLREFYENKLRGNIKNEIEAIENNLSRFNLAKLSYPTYDEFKLENGEEFLANEYPIFGEDISAYLTFAALTNQFINCKLVGINYKRTLFFKEGELQENLTQYFNIYFGEDYYNSITTYSNFNMFYTEIRNKLFNSFTFKFKKDANRRWEIISSYSNKLFENQLLRFCAIQYFQNNYYYPDEIKNKNHDIEYTRSNYFLDCIAVARTINLEQIDYSDEYKNKIKAYQNLDYFRTKVINYIGTTTRGRRFNYLPIKPLSGFLNTDETSKALETIDLLIENDDFIGNNIFNFKRNFEDKTTEQKIESFYRILLEDFFMSLETYKKVTINGDRLLVKPITAYIPLPNPSRVINLVQPADYEPNYLEQYSRCISELYGSEETYQNIINEALKNLNQEN